MISYAQNFEDVILWRALKHVDNGFYVDVGAWSPDSDSVTKLFYENGWRGINVEPNQAFHKQYLESRKEDINLNIAVSNEKGTATIHFNDNSGLTSLDKKVADSHKKIGLSSKPSEVTVSTLDAILAKHASRKDIHFLKIDVEGFEKNVLLGNDWQKFRPWVLVIEATKPMSQEESYQDWESIVLDAKYTFAYADGLNRFYVANEHQELLEAFKYPPNVFDGFLLSSQTAAEAKAIEAEAKASEAEAKASEAEAKASEAEAKASEAEAKAKASEAKASEAEAKANEAEAKANEAEAKANEAEAKSKQLRKQLDDWQLIVAQSQQSAIQAQLDLKQVEGQLTEKIEIIDQMSSEFLSEKSLSQSLSIELIEKKNKIQEQSAEIEALNQNSHHWYLQAQSFEQQLSDVRQGLAMAEDKIVELNHSSHHWWTQAQNLEQNLHATHGLYESVLKSKSWKITLPLRLVVKFIKWLVRGSYAWLTFAPQSRPRRVLKILLVKTKNYVIVRPKLKRFVLKLINFSPKLKNRLRLLGLAQSPLHISKINNSSLSSVGFINANRVEGDIETVNLEQLTPRAKQIYAQLKQAIEQNKKESA